MAHKHLKNSGMAAIVLRCALGVAQAADQSPPPLDASQLRTLHSLLNPKSGAPLPQMGGGRLSPGANLPTGWNFEICTQSFFQTNGSTFTVFAVNRDGTFFFQSTGGGQGTIQTQLLAACQHAGGGYFVHIIDSSTHT